MRPPVAGPRNLGTPTWSSRKYHTAPGTNDTASQATHMTLFPRHPLGQVTLQQAAESSQGSQPERRAIQAHTDSVWLSSESSLMGDQMDLREGYSRWVASTTGHGSIHIRHLGSCHPARTRRAQVSSSLPAPHSPSPGLSPGSGKLNFSKKGSANLDWGNYSTVPRTPPLNGFAFPPRPRDALQDIPHFLSS